MIFIATGSRRLGQITFVTPALAFFTASVNEALKVGWRMIRETWPACALYVFAPPLALEALARAWWVGPLGIIGSIVVGLLGGLVGLASKGATAAFFLRRYPSGDDGAAFAHQGSQVDPVAAPPRPDTGS